MTEVRMRGSRSNVIGLLLCMADEIKLGQPMSSTAFAEHPGDDPLHILRVEVVEDQPHDTTLKVWP